jgi:blue copper oxidase
MLFSRRSVLLGAGASAVGGFNMPCLAAARRNPLAIPKLIEGAPGATGTLYELETTAGTSNFLPGLSTPTIGINGPYLGPTIRCRAGDRVSLRVKNNLTEPTTLHWHGLHLPARQDGGPHQVIEPGKVWEPSFEIKQKASLCWYHAHMIEQTGEQVARGLAGLFLIDDDETRALRLPADYGIDDIPLVIQDRRFKADGSFEYMSNMGDAELGYQGDVILVNGTVAPQLELRRQRTRLRILNGSNSRIYMLGRDDSADLLVIGADGSLLERPARMRRVRLGPGERIELLVDMQPDRTVTLMSYPVIAGAMGSGMMMMHGTRGSNETFPIIELRAGRLESADLSIPERLIKVPQWAPAQSARTRIFTLHMSTMGMGPMPGPSMDGAMGINGRSMDMDRINERVPLGSIEIWEIRNATMLTHPFHIHGIQFRVLDRNGGPPQPHEQGLKDTVLVDPGSRVRVIAEFVDYADPDRPYMYHCHNLEHEDAGMMGQFVVI